MYIVLLVIRRLQITNARSVRSNDIDRRVSSVVIVFATAPHPPRILAMNREGHAALDIWSAVLVGVIMHRNFKCFVTSPPPSPRRHSVDTPTPQISRYYFCVYFCSGGSATLAASSAGQASVDNAERQGRRCRR